MGNSKVTAAYQRIEQSVVQAYRTVEATVVQGYMKIEDAFVSRFLVHQGETTADAKKRLKNQ